MIPRLGTGVSDYHYSDDDLGTSFNQSKDFKQNQA